MQQDNCFEVIRVEDHTPELGVMIGSLYILRDKQTGVHYLFAKSGYAGGLTPLLGADGKPIVSK